MGSFALNVSRISRGSKMVDVFQTTLQNTFKLAEFREPQKTVCNLVFKGNNVLFVAPTGKGKSLCYQLPGILLGKTLVISPLIALMDDQCSKINNLGLRAARLHSGLKDSELAQVTQDYINNNINFLFVAPERLATNFGEILMSHPPSLIAVDEAHSISTFGQFRPDYRLLQGRLPPGVPIVALTATATPKVQMDILEQLNIKDAQLIAHGFRRDNIAITVKICPSKEREARIAAYLKNSETKPAIVYCGTRKQTESVAALLKKQGHKCEAYHAGMTSKNRQDVQERFMSGDLSIISSTCAFGMGVDKSNIRTVLHASMPSSLEDYYQEIGRAGRDGLPSKAVLFTNYEDKAKQTWFLDKSYPPVDQLDLIYSKLTDTPQTLEAITYSTPFNEETVNTILGKLLSYKAATKSFNSYVKGEIKAFRKAYLESRNFAVDKLESMSKFTQATGCRMLEFLHYFGDTNDDYAPCNMCDNCKDLATKTPEALKSRSVTKPEVKPEGLIIGSWVQHVKYGKGKVEASEKGSMGNRQATVRFADGTRRVIIEKYLKPV